MSLPRTLPILLIAALAGCPADDVGLTDEAGTTTAPGESTSDDTTSTDTGTDTSTSAELPEPCEIAWIWHGSVVYGTDSLGSHTPLVLDGDEVVVAHRVGSVPYVDTRVTRSSSEGVLVGGVELELSSGWDAPQSLLRLSNGDLVLGSTNTDGLGAQVDRLGPSGERRWTFTGGSASGGLLGLAERPEGTIVSLVSTLSAANYDFALRVHDPDSGEVLETWVYDATSDDYGWGLVAGPRGELFVATSTLVGETLRPLVFGLAPGSINAPPSWQTPLDSDVVEDVAPRAIALSPGGPLLIVDQQYEGGWQTRLSALDPASGELLWMVDRDTLGIPPVDFAFVGALAADADKAVIAGEWRLPGGDQQEAFIIEVDLAGNPICHTSISDFDPATGLNGHLWAIYDAKIDASGRVFASGYAHPQSGPDAPIDLLMLEFF